MVVRRKARIIIEDNEKYFVQSTSPFSVGYGTIGSKGYRITRARDRYSMGHYKSIGEFRESRKYNRRHA